MNRSKLLRSTIQLGLNSLNSVSTRQLGLNSLTSTQVTRFSSLTQPPFFPKTPQIIFNNYFNLNKKLFFSSESESHSYIDVILSNDWSEKIEIELEKLNPNWTHESVVYVLMKLDRNPQKSLDFFRWVTVRFGFNPSYVPYCVLIRSLACKGYGDKFREIALEMQEKGFFIDKPFHFNVMSDLKKAEMKSVAEDWKRMYLTMCVVYDGDECVKDVVKAILECDWCGDVERKLEKKVDFPVSENFVLWVLREVWKEPVRSLRFFDWVGKVGGYKHDSVTYSSLLRNLAEEGTVKEFWEVFERMRSDGFDVDFDSMIKSFRQLPAGDSVKLYEIMMDGPYRLSLPECNLLLRHIVHESNPDVELGYRVVNKLKAAGEVLSKREYDGMHRILCKSGRIDEAKKILQEMRDAGYEPDNITYSQELFGLCIEKRFEEACNLIEQMEAEGCVPDVKTWTILLQGYCNADKVDEALSCFAQMQEKNANVDGETLKVLIEGFLSKDKVLGAYTFLVEMVNKGGIKPWQLTYQLMIEKLSEIGKLDEALELLTLMKKDGYPPFAQPINQYIAKSGTVDDAKKLLKAITFKTAPKTACYVRSIKSFIEEGRESEARDLIYSSPYRVRSQKEVRDMITSLKA